MTYHSNIDSLVCHYCGRRKRLRDTCPVCGKKYLRQFGIGTQQVEDQVKKYFPGKKVLRMDFDTTRNKDAHVKIYEQFKEGKADILIGTQMIAKGLDFENVSLVGIIAADISLHIPDFRSAERTFQLLEQVSGRSGRKDPGKVVVQTYTPEHYAIEYSKNHDFEGFFSKEMGVRKVAVLPPYSVFFRIVFAGKDEELTIKACNEYGDGLKIELSDIMKHILLFDISEAAVKKIEGNVRWQILIKVLNDEKLAEVRKRIYSYSDNKNYAGCSFGMEINPPSMM
jgi:primosomal protein N' (replication factor Y)